MSHFFCLVLIDFHFSNRLVLKINFENISRLLKQRMNNIHICILINKLTLKLSLTSYISIERIHVTNLDWFFSVLETTRTIFFKILCIVIGVSWWSLVKLWCWLVPTFCLFDVVIIVIVAIIFFLLISNRNVYPMDFSVVFANNHSLRKYHFLSYSRDVFLSHNEQCCSILVIFYTRLILYVLFVKMFYLFFNILLLVDRMQKYEWEYIFQN